MKTIMMSCMMDGFPIEEIVSTAVACGMDGIDWVDLHGHTAAELKKFCRDAGLPITAHTGCKEGFLHRAPNAVEEFKTMLDDAVTLEAPVLMIPPFPRDGQRSLAEERKEYTEYYAEITPLAQAAGVTLTLESTGYGTSSIVGAQECLEVLRQVPGLRVTFDPGNVATLEDPLLAYCALKEYIVYLHFKDWQFSSVPAPGFAPVRSGKFVKDTLIGTGEMPLCELWSQMEARHKALPVNLETRDFEGKRSPMELYRKLVPEMKKW